MKKSTGKKVLIALLLIIALMLVGGFFLTRNILTLGEDVIDFPWTQEEEDDFVVEQLDDLRTEATLSSVLKSWAAITKKSNLMRREDVTNILLVGLDKSAGNSDVMMLCSINTAENKIFLTSVMRDSYTYIKTEDGDRYAKLNAAYALGGIDCLRETFQNNFKIKIDHYATVDFSTFSEIVDTLDGINMTVEKYEAAEIDKRIKTNYTKAYPPCPYGEDVLLEGIYALTFCRIRGCYNDADVHRTLNQRKFITTLIDKSKDVSLGQSKTIISTLLKYVKTDMSATEIMSIASKAITGKWYNYEIVSSCYPEAVERLDYCGNSWVWIVDYPLCAQNMQKLIYGKTNISLRDDRISAIDIIRNKMDKGEANP